MPYISFNGQLFEITQDQYNSYTIGDPLPAGAVLANPSNVASGGTVTVTSTSTAEILAPNTTNNTPGQTLTTSYQSTSTSNSTTANSSYASTGVVTISDSLAANSANSVYAAATAGLTAAQLTALGGADPTDPYIRARLGLPALSDIQTLSGAIANVNFGNVGNAVGNLVTSFGNTVSNISLGDIGNTFSNVATSFGNAVSDVGNTFTNIGNTVSDAATAVGNSISNIGDYFSGNTATTISNSQVANTDSTTVSTSTADAGSGATTLAPENVAPVDTAPAPVDYNAGLAGTDPVPASQVDTAPAPVSSAVDPQASLAPGETVVPASDTNNSSTTTNTDYYATPDAVGPAPTDVNVAAADTAAQDYYATPDAVGPAPTDVNVAAADAAAQGYGTAGGTDIFGSDLNPSAAPVTNDWQAQVADTQANATTTYNADGTVASVNAGGGTSADSTNASANIQGLVKNAQQQNVIAAQRKQVNNGDWRVRLRLAPQANYLYRAAKPGILQPLKITDGVIFPYTPAITTAYRANYSNYDLTHSNYRGYFYQNSYIDAINVNAVFTAQDTNDANYLLAVIHFFRSVTKMFYGKDQMRGSPPPVVYLTGLGEYQFNEHPCLVQQFSYNLPADVDYIRAGSPNNSGLDFNNIRDRQSVATNSIFNSVNRLAAAFLTKGAINQGTNLASPPTLGLNRPTYVPTKMEISITLLPIQSRQQVSQQFSLEGFASGDLLKGGFW